MNKNIVINFEEVIQEGFVPKKQVNMTIYHKYLVLGY